MTAADRETAVSNYTRELRESTSGAFVEGEKIELRDKLYPTSDPLNNKILLENNWSPNSFLDVRQQRLTNFIKVCRFELCVNKIYKPSLIK